MVTWNPEFATYHVNPFPRWLAMHIRTARAQHNCDNDCHSDDAPPEDTQHRPTGSLNGVHLETPEAGVELGISHSNQNDGVDAEHGVVEAHSGFWCQGMPLGILLSNGRRVEEKGGGNAVANKAQEIQSRKVDTEALCRASVPIEDGLRIERCTPGKYAADMSMPPFCSPSKEPDSLNPTKKSIMLVSDEKSKTTTWILPGNGLFEKDRLVIGCHDWRSGTSEARLDQRSIERQLV